MIDFRTDGAGRVIRLSTAGPLDIVTAEALSLLGLLYYEFSKQDQSAANLFAKSVQNMIANVEGGIFTPSMLDLARAAEVEVPHDDDV